MNKLVLGLLSILLVGLLIVGCSEKPVDPVSNNDLIKLANFMLPPGATLESATFNIYVVASSDRTVEIKRITGNWDEATVSWNSFGGAYASDVYGSFVVNSLGWHSVDLTTLVQEWLDGTYDNFGFLLDQEGITYPRSIFQSSDNISDIPYMEICYSIGGVPYCENINPLGDSYINEYFPDLTHGFLDILFTGWAADNGYEKQSMLMFEFTPAPRLASIGDKVWYDDNEDGIQDAGEPGVEGVVVSLYNCAGDLLATTVTDANGNYWFTNLPAGDYYVGFALPSGYEFSMQDQGADDAADSDADPTTGMAICTTLDPGENDMTWDAGIFIPEEECGICDGKITELTLRYLGAASADIVVETRKGSVIFSGSVAAGATFNFVGNDRHGTMGPEITVFVNGVEHVEIHTSCSQLLEIGMIFGDFEVIDGYSRNGGRICTYQ